jgi:ribosome-associated heat shock protein Hsp15
LRFTISIHDAFPQLDITRIDKWLWAARFFKTRSLATDAVEHGKVRLNGERTKPSHSVRIGDRLDIDNGSTVWEVLIKGIADKRASAAIAQALYGETEDSVRKRIEAAERHRLFREPAAELKGRPTKRDRRLLDRSSS